MKNLSIFRKTTKVNEEEVQLLIIINREAFEEAVKSNWDSFVFADNNAEIAYLEIGQYVFSLYVTGDIFVKDLIRGKEYTNKDKEILKELAISKEIYDENKYEIIENNWFAISLSTESDTIRDGKILYNTYEDFTFTDSPKTVEELIELLMYYSLGSMTDDEKSTPSPVDTVVFKRMISDSKGNSEEAKITIYKKEADLAILSGWDSLVFADNETWFANITIGNRSMDLGTSGTVDIRDSENEMIFSNRDWKELGDKLLREGYLDDDKYNISNNNWFSLLLANGKPNSNGELEYETYDDVVFEETPNSILELADTLAVYAQNVVGSEGCI